MYLLGFIPSAIIVFLAMLLHDAFIYPLSEQAIYEKIESDVISAGRAQGILVLVTETDDNYTGHVFVRSRLINRFRLYGQFEYQAQNPFFAAICGHKIPYVLELAGQSIYFHAGSGDLFREYVIRTLFLIFNVNNVICVTVVWRRNNKTTPSKSSA